MRWYCRPSRATVGPNEPYGKREIHLNTIIYMYSPCMYNKCFEIGQSPHIFVISIGVLINCTSLCYGMVGHDRDRWRRADDDDDRTLWTKYSCAQRRRIPKSNMVRATHVYEHRACMLYEYTRMDIYFYIRVIYNRGPRRIWMNMNAHVFHSFYVSVMPSQFDSSLSYYRMLFTQTVAAAHRYFRISLNVRWWCWDAFDLSLNSIHCGNKPQLASGTMLCQRIDDG